MKKLATILFSLIFTSNSFGMLIPKTFNIKKVRSFCTQTSPYDKKILWNHPLMFQENELNFSTKDNRALLHEIIEQNKETNELLRAIFTQTYLNSHLNSEKHLQEYLKNGMYMSPKRLKTYRDLFEHYRTLKKQYGIDIPNE